MSNRYAVYVKLMHKVALHTQRNNAMMKFTISAAALIAVAAFVTVPGEGRSYRRRADQTKWQVLEGLSRT